ncbi:hypothetical protein ENUP19_0303G0005 [Entamoeba nuttalli]|uniref:Serine/threonine protein kinase, putative n=2 Tax=Entamoeba nuttalli TaxID=412467 RepID=K2GGD5_ENTNP|nr:serine/threonine protein kinase, putative [Entamoeba nuttalli P19]EKE41806.1 serine/threonine protein kinase, putative [Entamoeba nuttalli P19]|eukprot:XP_008855860.1 serine/threonine protein kinase, putative [Entamoeba nuttalli P19]
MSQCYRVGQFIIGKKLGEGMCGKVYLAFHEKTGVKVAIKIVDKTKLMRKPEMKRKVEREIAFLKIINHRNVMQLYTVYETTRYLFLVMELLEGGELFDYISSKGKLEIEEVLVYFQQLIFAVEHFHSRHICHHDLKPENLLLTKDLQTIKVCDFGMSSYCGNNKLREYCGSPHYTAPEVCKKEAYDGLIADIWSCGVILYVMAFGLMPFDGDTLEELIEKVKVGKFVYPEDIEVPEEVKDLINRMLIINPKERITIKEIKEHKFFQSNNPIIENVPSVIEEAGEPIKNIDSNIMAILCYLLNNVHITEIRENLFDPEPNTIRAFYRLLEQHRKNAQGDPFAFSRNSPGPQSLKNTIFAIPGTSPSDVAFSPAFNDLANRIKVEIPHVKTPKPAPSPMMINQEVNNSISMGQSPIMFSVPREAEWGFVAANNVSTTEIIELDCSVQTARNKVEKAFNELGIKWKKEGEVYECDYKYLEEEDVNVMFEVSIEEGEINEISAGFGIVTTIRFVYTQGDIVSFSDVYNLITKLVTDVDY